jgi:serine/threonine protein kinase
VNLAPGAVIAEKYRVQSELGRGGMGTVWLAEHLTLGVQAAIKVIDYGAATEESARRRFLQEAKTAASLSSPHVVQIFDYGVHEGMPFIVMERLVGETLRARLQRETVLSPALTATIFTQIGRAMQKAQDFGVVHRDLKPDNVFLVSGDDEVTVKVLDFGVAKVVRGLSDAAETTGSGALVGTPHYMSPEQAHGGKRVDHRSDLWSLAVLAFQCITGQLPFQAQGWGELVAKICRDPLPVPSSVHEVPVAFDEWFERATRRDPDARFQSIREFTEELRGVLLGAGGPLRMKSSLPPNAIPPTKAAPDAPTQELFVAGTRIASELGSTRPDEPAMPPDLRTLSSTTIPTSSIASERRGQVGRLGVVVAVVAAGGLLAVYFAFSSSADERASPSAAPPEKQPVSLSVPAALPTSNAAPQAEAPSVPAEPTPPLSATVSKPEPRATNLRERVPVPSASPSAIPVEGAPPLPLRSAEVLMERE